MLYRKKLRIVCKCSIAGGVRIGKYGRRYTCRDNGTEPIGNRDRTVVHVIRDEDKFVGSGTQKREVRQRTGIAQRRRKCYAYTDKLGAKGLGKNLNSCPPLNLGTTICPLHRSNGSLK
ncbi:hypothetical protein L195_g039401 [Trifolium pratense]|uniref:Uncharacterized protein n=1 Tax=Trifolium pratense TaxID=57577 RepID=A0A2K3LXU5_TRIPR|nr:hypothetical protein L195_g039401 [Trifolium pratense]